ncbi:MAG TPA: hypothetical protein VFG51_03485 [Candidatus Saccharimonadia bacterium]|nr:hypothetical protein [Candidatus Saccharimonadia bacterium]
MSTKLSEELAKFYIRKKKSVIFHHGYSLNHLALSMWEYLGFAGMDASTLSRVISGERLFTPKQIEAFGRVLYLSESEIQLIHRAVYKDQLLRAGIVATDEFFFQLGQETDELLESLLIYCWKLLYEGKHEELRILTMALNTNFKTQINLINNKQSRDTILDLLYLEGRAISSLSASNNVNEEIISVVQSIHKIAEAGESQRQLATAYISTLQSNALYIHGGYSHAKKKEQVYAKSIKWGKKALAAFPHTHPDKLFAARVMYASLSYFDKTSITDKYVEDAKKLVDPVGEAGSINALHLYATLAKLYSNAGHTNGLDLLYWSRKQYKEKLNGRGIYEISDIRNELELYVRLNIHDDTHVKPLIARGLQLADHGRISRYTKNIQNLAKKLR